MKFRLLAAVLTLGFLAARLAALTLEELAADTQLWPAEVTVLSSTRGTIIKEGKPAGAMLVGSGKKLTVLGIAAAGITGKLGGATVLVPVEKTNLWTEVERLHPEQAGEAPGAEEAVPAEVPVAAAKPAPAAPAAAAKTSAGPSVMQRRLAGKIMRLEDGTLKPVDAASLGGIKFYGLYYSASWCGPCRQFTPQFVAAYRLIKQRHPEFEVVFVSADRSAGDMVKYVKDDRMPWLAMKYDEAQRDGELRRYGGPGIPCLVLVDPAGVVLSDSFEGDQYVGPGKVLADAQRLMAQAR
jgi:nucleoredoxin